jgi:hypothetical protein
MSTLLDESATLGPTIGDPDPHATSAEESYSFTYRIATNRLQILRANLAKLNRRAEKLGAEPFTMGLGRRGQEFIENRSEGYAATINWVEVTLTGTPFSLGDYRIFAVIDHRKDAYNAVGNFEIPTRFIGCEPQCDHCKTKRDRSKTYLLTDPAGNISAVGSSCLEDFTGHAPEHALAATSIWTEFGAQMKDLEGGYEEERRGAAFLPAAPTLPFLAVVNQFIRTQGWVSKDKANTNREYGIEPNVSTAERALESISNKEGSDEEIMAKLDLPMEDIVAARATLAYVREKYASLLDQPSAQAFDLNMRSVTLGDMFIRDLAGFAAFSVRMYQREVLEPAHKARAAAQSDFVGSVGKREIFTVTARRLIPIESQFGLRMLHVLDDAHGNVLIWRNSGSGGSDLEVGKTYTVKATVTDHEIRNEVRQTKLSRVSTVDAPAVEATSETTAPRKRQAKPTAQQPEHDQSNDLSP